VTASFFVGDGSQLTNIITGSGTPGGSNTEIQFNSGSVFSGRAHFRSNYISQSLEHGLTVTASGLYSHAEGDNTQAIGNYSHAEGVNTQALGLVSHTEGATTQALGIGSHAEGRETQAIGNYSHAEGRSTISLGANQHVQGQFNITSSAQSSFIIGNGTSDSLRSNLVFASGSQFQITGSLNVRDIIQLERRTTTPTPSEGMIIASGSAGSSVLYYYNGTTWNALF
jgi:hypothetical protein